MNITDLLEDKKICICAGSGGVGKTTTAAAVALGMAASGKKVVVITIDPAKRLATALGLSELNNTAKKIDRRRFTRHGVEMKGELWAMMLDPKRTWDELVERRISDPTSRANILNNRIYQQLSNAVAGSQEYSAMEKLYELYSEGSFDLLVLDTPPSRNALDFLEAPDRLTRFLEGKSLQFFLRPGMRFLGRGSSIVFSVLKRLTGLDLLRELSEFFQVIAELTDGFSEHAQAIKKLLSDRHTTFLLVSAPAREPIEEAKYFYARMQEAKLPFGAALVNKVHHDHLRHLKQAHIPDKKQLTSQLRTKLPAQFSDSLIEKIADNFTDYHTLCQRDSANIDSLTDEIDANLVVQIPYLDDDIHDIDGLLQLNNYLLDGRRKAI